jgi:hypothetical protein
MDTAAPAVNPAATPAPSPAPAAKPAAAPKPTFEKFENLADSPGNVVSDPPVTKVPIEAPEDEAQEEKPEAKEAKAPPEAKPEKKPEPKPRYKVKVDGQETELDLDEILAGYQRAAASTKRSQEAAAQRKEAEALKAQLEQAVQQLQTSTPEQILRALGRSPEEIASFAEEALRRQLEEAKLSPKDRELAQLRRQYDQQQLQVQHYQEQMQQLEQERAQTAEQAQHDAEIAQYSAKIDQELPIAMEKSGLPRTPVTAALVARVMAEQLDAGNESFTIEDAAALARESITQWMTHFLSDDLPVETLRAIIPEKALAKVREAAVQKATGSAPPEAKPPAPKKQAKQQITSFAKLYDDDLYAGDAADPITTSLVR